MKVGAMSGTCGHCGALMVVYSDMPAGYCPCCGKFAFGLFTKPDDLERLKKAKRKRLGSQYQTAKTFFRDNYDDH